MARPAWNSSFLYCASYAHAFRSRSPPPTTSRGKKLGFPQNSQLMEAEITPPVPSELHQHPNYSHSEKNTWTTKAEVVVTDFTSLRRKQEKPGHPAQRPACKVSLPKNKFAWWIPQWNLDLSQNTKVSNRTSSPQQGQQMHRKANSQHHQLSGSGGSYLLRNVCFFLQQPQ